MFKHENWFVTKEITNDYGEKRTEELFRIWKLIKYVIVGIIVLIVFFGSFGTIDAGERGVKTRFGAVVGLVEQGLYFKLPIIEQVHKMNVQTKTVKYELEDPLFSASKDLQDVKISVLLNYRLDPTQVKTIYQQYGTVEQYEERIVRPAVRDTVKAVSAQFTAEELVTKRPQFTDEVVRVLNERLADKYVTTERVNITNFEFSKSFSAAIEAKVTAVQNAEAAKNKLEQIKFEAQQTIETAKAQAEAIRIQAQAINSQGGADYVALKAVEKWNGILPVQMIPNSSVPFINLTK
jgi:regulator of protease activity HflC (stomatin/prohibitin superfamily)